MVFNVLASVLAWFMASAMASAVILSMAPSDPAPALVFALDWRNVLGWIAGALFAMLVYRALARKDRALARQSALGETSSKNS